METPKPLISPADLGDNALEALHEGEIGNIKHLHVLPHKMFRPVIVELAEEFSLPVVDIVAVVKRVMDAAFTEKRITLDEYMDMMSCLTDIEEDPE